jgi:hypothetical protein
MAIVVISQCVTKMRPSAGAVLVPAINTTAWEQGLGCRIMLFRDWGWDDDEGKQVDEGGGNCCSRGEGEVCWVYDR